MKKIPTLFIRDPENMGRVLPEINSACQWVIDGEGRAFRKLDGTSCLVVNEELYKRRIVKKGKTPPKDFELRTVDENTGKQFGWIPCDLEDPANKYHKEAWESNEFQDGTYELVGPRIQGGAEIYYKKHELVNHKSTRLLISGIPRTFEELETTLRNCINEGIVWHHTDGRMAKIKCSDFGYKRIL